jgi:hypothetical protein
METEQLVTAMQAGHEVRGIEWKGELDFAEKASIAKVSRAMIGMANSRNGGSVVLGIDDTDPASMGPGLSAKALESWANFDEVSANLHKYADPPLIFSLKRHDFDNGKSVVELIVREFSEVPVLCKKTFPEILREGACYVRTYRQAETTEIPTQTEMRELIDLAVEKGLRRFVQRAEQAGLKLATSDEQQEYDEERDSAW